MAETERVENFQLAANTVLEWGSNKKTLIERDIWGDKNLRESEPLIDRILKMTKDLVALPIELIDDATLSRLDGMLTTVVKIFERISTFTTSDMVANQEGVADEIRSLHDQVLSIYRAEVAWLAIYSGTIQHWLSGARDEYKTTKEIREDTEKQLEVATEAAQVAREKAGAAGAAEFTAAFRKQAEIAKNGSRNWLLATGVVFGLATLATVTFVILHGIGIPPSPSTPTDALIYLGWRVGTVGLLFGASVWCGRHFRAHRHNYEVNQHREACLENMQAFQRAVEDQAVKDMVVLEFSRAAAQGMPTGFISGRAEARSDVSPHLLSLATKQASAVGG